MPVTKNNKSKSKSAAKVHGSSWKNNSKKPRDITLPSGETCRIRGAMGITDLITEGVLDSMDALTGIVATKTIPKAQGRPVKVSTQDIMSDPAKFKELLRTVDKIACYAVLEPEIVTNLRPIVDANGQPVTGEDGKPAFQEIPVDERDEDLIYVDQIPETDRFEIMNLCMGGLKGLATFRGDSEEALGDLPAE